MDKRAVIYPGKVSLFSSSRLNPDDMEWPATFSTVFATRIYESEKQSLPFAEGARWALKERRIIVERIQPRGDGLTVGLRYLDRGGRDKKNQPVRGGLFVLRNPETGAVAFSRQSSGGGTHFHKLLSVGYTEIEFDRFTVRPEELSRLECFHIRHELKGVDVRSVSYEVE
jgi:hypothetical protein